MITIKWVVMYRNNFMGEKMIRAVTASVKYDGELPDGNAVATEAPEEYKDLVREIIDYSKIAIKLLEKERTTYLRMEGLQDAGGLLKINKTWSNYFCKQKYRFFEYNQVLYEDLGLIFLEGLNDCVETFVTKIL